jgi:hypothetical protein
MSKSPKSRVRETTASPYGAEKRRPTNLTLSPEAMEKADRVAAARGTSVSRLVDDLLSALPDADARLLAEELTPAVKRLLGVARESALSEQDYRQHLIRKYGARE